MERMGLRDENLRVSVVCAFPALLAGAEDTATSPDVSVTRIRAILTEDGATAANKFFRILVMNVSGPALAVIRGSTYVNGAVAWRAFDHEIRSKHSAASSKSHERNPQCEDVSFRTHSS